MNLNERLGPLPVWAWGGIVVGGVGLGLLERRRVAAADAAAAAAAPPAAPSDLSSVMSTATTDASSFNPDTTTAPDSSNPYGVTDTWNVTGDLIYGQTNSSVGTENVSNPVQQIQAPAPVTPKPIGPARLPAPAAPPPVTAPAPTTTAVKAVNNPGTTYVVRPGDTYWALAQRFYGNPLDWPKLQAANGYAPTKIPIGATLRIPA